jgi:hypothetical protein
MSMLMDASSYCEFLSFYNGFNDADDSDGV